MDSALTFGKFLKDQYGIPESEIDRVNREGGRVFAVDDPVHCDDIEARNTPADRLLKSTFDTVIQDSEGRNGPPDTCFTTYDGSTVEVWFFFVGDDMILRLSPPGARRYLILSPDRISLAS